MNTDAEFKRLRAAVTTYLMDVGIEAKVEGSRTLPDVTPIHDVPRAVANAAQSALGWTNTWSSPRSTKSIPRPRAR